MKPNNQTYSRPHLLGNNIEHALKSLGVTEKRYKALKKAIGLPPNCNCQDRKQYLNRAHNWLRKTLQLEQEEQDAAHQASKHRDHAQGDPSGE